MPTRPSTASESGTGGGSGHCMRIRSISCGSDPLHVYLVHFIRIWSLLPYPVHFIQIRSHCMPIRSISYGSGPYHADPIHIIHALPVHFKGIRSILFEMVNIYSNSAHFIHILIRLLVFIQILDLPCEKTTLLMKIIQDISRMRIL